jgi:hypothetical protein
MRSGGLPAGSSRALRLDPYALPVRYAASDAAADERVRDIELHRERVVVRRAVRGMRMALNLPVSAFLGIVVRILPPEGEEQAAIAVVLEHKDPALALPLFISGESDDALVLWHSWARVLGLPLLVTENGSLREPFPRLGQVSVEAPCPRRRRRSALKRRRPSILLRRRPGKMSESPSVHRDEWEIIARN